MTAWIAAELGPEVPLHFSAFHPDFKIRDRPPTPPATLTRARRIALGEGLRYVYTGNVHDREGDTTCCPGCGAAVIERDWYELKGWRLTGDGHCRDVRVRRRRRVRRPARRVGGTPGAGGAAERAGEAAMSADRPTVRPPAVAGTFYPADPASPRRPGAPRAGGRHRAAGGAGRPESRPARDRRPPRRLRLLRPGGRHRLRPDRRSTRRDHPGRAARVRTTACRCGPWLCRRVDALATPLGLVPVDAAARDALAGRAGRHRRRPPARRRAQPRGAPPVPAGRSWAKGGASCPCSWSAGARTRRGRRARHALGRSRDPRGREHRPQPLPRPPHRPGPRRRHRRRGGVPAVVRRGAGRRPAARSRCAASWSRPNAATSASSCSTCAPRATPPATTTGWSATASFAVG